MAVNVEPIIYFQLDPNEFHKSLNGIELPNRMVHDLRYKNLPEITWWTMNLTKKFT